MNRWPELAAGLVAIVAMIAALRPIERPRVPAVRVDAVLAAGFAGSGEAVAARTRADATLVACTEHANAPPDDVARVIRSREAQRISYPADGRLSGDWKRGEAIAQSGYGMRFTDTDATRPNGGNCYACHRLSAAEESFGTLGPSLSGYGKSHGTRREAEKAAYDKIYNSQSATACSRMPRFGANGVLTIEQIKDLVALLTDPESPVNQ